VRFQFGALTKVKEACAKPEAVVVPAVSIAKHLFLHLSEVIVVLTDPWGVSADLLHFVILRNH
jgi:hypothetical protein